MSLSIPESIFIFFPIYIPLLFGVTTLSNPTLILRLLSLLMWLWMVRGQKLWGDSHVFVLSDSWWARILHTDSVSMVCHWHCPHYLVCLCVCSVHRLLKGGPHALPSPRKKWQRRPPNRSPVPLAPSVPRPSLPPPTVYWQIRGYRTMRTMNLNEPLRIRNHYLHGTDVHWIWIIRSRCHWAFKTHTHAKVWMLNISSVFPSAPVLCRSLGKWEIHAQWSSSIISWAWMSTIGPTSVSIILIR